MRAGGDATPSDGAVSHRQQVMRIAINTGVLALIRPQAWRSGTGIPYQLFQSAGLTTTWRTIASIWLAICARGYGGIDLPASPVAVRGLNSKANQPLTALR
jgi:hypothetical protein